MNNLERLLAISEKQVLKLQQEIAHLKKDLQALQNECDLQSKLNKNLRSEKDIAQQRIAELNKEIAFLDNDRNNLIEQVNQMSKFVLSVNDYTHSAALKKFSIVQQLQSLSQSYVKLQQDFIDLAQEKKAVEESAELLRRKIGDLQNQVLELTVEKERYLLTLQETKDMEDKDDKELSIEYEDQESDTQFDPQLKAYVEELEQTIENMKQQLMLKERHIVRVEEQLLALQTREVTVKPPKLQDPKVELPLYLKNRLFVLQNLEGLFPKLCDKVAELQAKQAAYTEKLEEMRSLKHAFEEISEQLNQVSSDRDTLKSEVQYLATTLNKIVEENHALKNQIIANLGKEALSGMMMQVRREGVDLSDTPFASVKELIDGYLSLKGKINKISQQKLLQSI